MIADLEASGALEKVEPHTLSIGRCDRSKTIVEPLTSTQWFVKTKPLADKAIRVVETGQIKLYPEAVTKTYNEWMYNIRDWCVSRQLWWGHRIPAWHCGGCSEIIVAREEPEACLRCGSADLRIRTRTFSIPGSVPVCGRSRRSAGRTIRQTCGRFIPLRCSSQASTFCFSGSRA